MTTFIYVLIDPETGLVRYVGKADEPIARLKHHLRDRKRTHKTHWIASLITKGLRPVLEILEEIPVEGWQEVEKEYIRVFRVVGMNLTNSTDGGEGTKFFLGKSLSEAHRQAISKGNQGKTTSPAECERRRKRATGVVRTSESREKQSRSTKGIKKSDAHRAAISAGRRGYKLSEAARLKISISQKRRFQTHNPIRPRNSKGRYEATTPTPTV